MKYKEENFSWKESGHCKKKPNYQKGVYLLPE